MSDKKQGHDAPGQTERNIQAGSEPLTGNRNQHPQANVENSPAANTGLGYNGEFRLGEKITLRLAGSGELEILKAGDPTPIKISDVELASMIDERYFARVDKGL